MKETIKTIISIIVVFTVIVAGSALLVLLLNYVFDARDNSRKEETTKKCSQTAELSDAQDWKVLGTSYCIIIKNNKIVEVEQ